MKAFVTVSLIAISIVLTVELAVAGDSLSAAQREELAAYNFRPAIEACSPASSALGIPLPANATAEARWLTSALITSGGDLWSPGSTVATLSFFTKSRGIAPDDGIALFPDLDTQQGYEQFNLMSPADRFEHYKDGVNRLTGHFYSTFHLGWNEGGIGFKQVELSGDTVIKGRGHTLKIRGDEGASAKFYYELYGGAEDQVLFTDNAVIPVAN